MTDLEKVLKYYNISIFSTKEKIVCPFHADINASLLLDVNEDKWFCFGCQKGGDAYKFHKEYQNKLGNNNDLKILYEFSQIKSKGGSNKHKLVQIIEEPRDRKYYRQKLIEAKDYYYGLKKVDWYTDDSELTDYMQWRGFKRRTLQKAKAKYTYQESYPIVFPILDNSRFKGWVSRTFDTELAKKRKYLYNQGFRRRNTLSGTYKSDVVMIVEGHMDMLKAKQLGYKNVVAILGWKITDTQIEKLKDAGIKLVISALDNDECGIKGTAYLKHHFEVIRFPYPDNIKDMGDMTSKVFNKNIKYINEQVENWRES